MIGRIFSARAADDAPPSGQYLSEYNSAGELLLSKNFLEWIFVGSPDREPNLQVADSFPLPSWRRRECAFCHIASAKKGAVWPQFYPLLDK